MKEVDEVRQPALESPASRLDEGWLEATEPLRRRELQQLEDVGHLRRYLLQSRTQPLEIAVASIHLSSVAQLL